MALFKVNTGCRDQEVCGLRWEWEVAVPELETSVFIVPGNWVKNGEDRVIVLNRVAASVVGSVRGEHPEQVFVTGAGVSRQCTTPAGSRRASGQGSSRLGCTT
jgi:integrase